MLGCTLPKMSVKTSRLVGILDDPLPKISDDPDGFEGPIPISNPALPQS